MATTQTERAATSESGGADTELLARLAGRVGSRACVRSGTAEPIGTSLREMIARVESWPTVEEAPQPGAAAPSISASTSWEALKRAFGSRYADCRLANFVCGGPEFDSLQDKEKRAAALARQQAAHDTLRRLAAHVYEHVNGGGNVVLYGPPGTGKDHLLVAVLRAAVAARFSATWINGQDLYGRLRDRIDSGVSEDALIREFCREDILVLSDPVPPKGSASDYSATMLYRIIDRRYREMKSTWISVNVAGANEAVGALTGPVFDRLLDNSVRVYCDWPSYRRARKPEWMNSLR